MAAHLVTILSSTRRSQERWLVRGTRMKVDLLTRRETRFVLWRPKNTTTAPKLVIGQFQAGNPPTLAGEQTFNLTGAAGFPDLWEIAASACHLTDGEIYHYWFEIDDSDDEKNPKKPI